MNTKIARAIVPALLLGATLLPMAAHADTINQRLHDQRQRIEQGVDSGQLTRREQYRLNEREARLHHQEYRDRLSGGRFTPAERRRLQHEENHVSGDIYRQKHDDQVR